MAILLEEPEGERCQQAIAFDDKPIISAANLAEALIAAGRRGLQSEMQSLIDGLSIGVIEVTQDAALRAADAYSRLGKGNHPARLNYGDCFAYEVARTHDCSLLFIGDDFSQTDVESVL